MAEHDHLKWMMEPETFKISKVNLAIIILTRISIIAENAGVKELARFALDALKDNENESK